MSKVSKIKVENNLKQAVKKAVQEIGYAGFYKRIRAGELVLLKPNFNTSDPFPASTSVDFLKAVVELVLDCNPAEVIIGDSSTFFSNTRKEMGKLGVFALEKMYRKVKVLNFDEGKWRKRKIPNGKYLNSVQVPEILDKVDKLILLPCLKTHSLAQFTGALKLSVGMVRPIERLGLHFTKLQEKIAELNTVIKPNLIIMDARKCFITRGPMDGEIRCPNLILASESRTAIDIEGIKIIKSFAGNSLSKIEPWQLPQIKRALEIGIK